jgi:CubicO group peptidase (beta-lactamase class C family)
MTHRFGRTSALLILAFAIFAASFASAADLKTTKAERVGMSTERLARIHDVMQRHIDTGRITGAVTAVARRGKLVHHEAHGFRDPNTQSPMPQDALFRMASSSKPVTGVAVLMLVEEGRIRLNDPVSAYIPEFKNLKVAVPKPGMTEQDARRANGGKGDVDLVAATREITIKDLMTHTSGLQSGGLGTVVSPVPRKNDETLATYIPKLAAAPLDFQPGTRWAYSALAGIDTLGRIVEIVSGKSFDEFLRTRLFEPLGMRDTHFVIPEAKQPRLLPLFRRDGDAWVISSTPGFLDTRSYLSGAAGLYSTAHDYIRFEQMLVNGGALEGKRLLSPKTVHLMSQNHVGELYRGTSGSESGQGFGLTVYVTLDETKASRWRTEGAFGWSGAFGTITWSDPAEELIAVLMIQQSDATVQRDFNTAVMQAVTESNVH